MTSTVNDTIITSPAGLPLSVECSSIPISDNLIRPLIVQWMGLGDYVQSDTGTLTSSPLLTSHGGVYICGVTISIPKISFQLTEEANSKK